ncbi:MAG: hypothetical protein K2Y21_09015 [Phycisphaerales bacterium]|nr:hypothetical protein [Phycisphaerales bacterium]
MPDSDGCVPIVYPRSAAAKASRGSCVSRTAWTQRASGGPVPRFEHAMAFDAARDRVILFGGYAAGTIAQADAWSWDGTSWTKVATIGPSVRFYPTMTWVPRYVLRGRLCRSSDCRDDL